MKTGLLFILLITLFASLIGGAFGSETAQLPSHIRYQIGPKAEVEFWNKLDDLLEREDYRTIKTPGKEQSLNAVEWTERIYATPVGNKVLFVRSGLELPDEFTGKLIPQKHGHLLHLNIDNIGFAFFFRNYKKSQITKFQKALSKRMNVSFNLIEWLNPISSAHANGCRTDDSSSSWMTRYLDDGLTLDLARGVWECGHGIGGGAYNSTVGVLEGLYHLGEGAVWATLNPSAAWDKANEHYDKFVAFIAQFKQKLSEAWSGFSNLPAHQQTHIMCEIIATIGVGGVIAYFTAGAGAPALLARLAVILRSMGGARFVAVAARLEGRAARIQQVAAGGGTALSAGRLAELKQAMVVWSERAVQWAARNNYIGRNFSVGGGLSLTVTEKVGHGFFGVVYRLRLNGNTAAMRRQFPDLFDANGVARTDLVVKFPNDVPLPEGASPWFRSIRQERSQGLEIQRALGNDSIPGAEILHASDQGMPFLIKPFVEARGLKSLGSHQGQLTAVQRRALRRDVFDRAERLKRESGVGLDIKPENIAWDVAAERWVMYEQTLLPRGLGGYFVNSGFDSYVSQVNLTMQRLSAVAPVAGHGVVTQGAYGAAVVNGTVQD